MVKDLDWNDAALLKLDLSPLLFQANMALAQLLERKMQAESLNDVNLSADARKYLECLQNMINQTEFERDTLLKIQAMQDLFRSEHINPTCENERVPSFDEAVEYMMRRGLDKRNKR